MLEDAKQLAELKVENDDVLALTYQLSGIQSYQNVVRCLYCYDLAASMQMDHGKMLTLLNMFQKWTMHTANDGATASRA